MCAEGEALRDEQFTRRGDMPVGQRRFLNSLAKLPGVEYARETRTWRGIRVAQMHDERAEFAHIMSGLDA